MELDAIGRSTICSDRAVHELFQWSTSCLVSMVVHELCGGDGGEGVRKARERGGDRKSVV